MPRPITLYLSEDEWDEIQALQIKNQTLQARLDNALGALGFYGDDKNWSDGVEGFGIFTRDDDKDEYDSIPEKPVASWHGKRARAALRRDEELKTKGGTIVTE